MKQKVKHYYLVCMDLEIRNKEEIEKVLKSRGYSRKLVLEKSLLIWF
jgi:hypothetical protein